MNSEEYKKKGARLPEPLRPYAKTAHLIRDNDGVHLYDEDWMFITSLRVASPHPPSSPPPSSPRIQERPPEPPPPETRLTGSALTRQVQVVVDGFRHAVKLHGIRADYFMENRLGKDWTERWERIWNGDLSPLLEDTQEFLPGKDLRTQGRGGLEILKAALVHELYVNSTLAGRSHGESESEAGRNMMNLLLFVCQLNHRGELDEVGATLAEADQMKLVNHFQLLGETIEDKRWMIQRVHQKLVFDFKRGRAWPEIPTAAAVKSALIFKLYENTNRLDRGDGTDMVRIVRELLVMQLD